MQNATLKELAALDRRDIRFREDAVADSDEIEVRLLGRLGVVPPADADVESTVIRRRRWSERDGDDLGRELDRIAELEARDVRGEIIPDLFGPRKIVDGAVIRMV